MIHDNIFGGSYTKGDSVPYTKEQLQEIFKRFDLNGDNFLSKAEVKKIFEYLKAYFPGLRTWQAMRKADTDGDGQIDQNELKNLINFVSSLNYKVEA